MANNGNNDKDAMDKIKDTAKQETKKIAKKGVKATIKFVAPALVIFLICLLALGVILIPIYSVINFFKGLLGIDATTTTTTVSEETSKMITITDYGYKWNKDYAKEILEELENKKVDVDVVDFDFTDMIEKYVEAEIKSMYPAILGDGETARNGYVDGVIKVYRMSAETGERSKLKYMDYDKFKDNVDSGNDEVLKYFTLKKDDFNLYIAISDSSGISMEPLDYRTTLQNYSTPLNYLISMHMICADKEFMQEFLKFIDEQTEIELTYVESTSIDKVQVDYRGTVNTIAYRTVKLENPQEEYGNGQYGDINEVSYRTIEDEPVPTEVNNENISDYSEYITPKEHMTENVTRMGSLYVTKANTWRVKSDLSLQKNDMVKTVIQDNKVTAKVEIDESDTKITNEEATGSYRKGKIEEITNEWIENYDISVTENAAGYDIEEFLKLIKKYPKVEENLESSPNMLFSMLEKNENTQELASVMRYTILQLSGIDYGVKELVFSEFISSQFSDIYVGTDIFLDYLNSWEDDVLWSYLKGKTTKYNSYIAKHMTKDGKKYICYSDGDDTKNFGFGVCHYYRGHNNNVGHYKKLGITITKYNLGSKLDVDIVDEVESMELESLRKGIEKKLKQAGIKLEEHQIHALMAVCYQWGGDAMDDFIPAYKKYGDTNKLRNNFIHSGDKPFLTGDEGREREIKRAQANWNLFHNGKYMAGDGKTELNPDDYVRGEFLQVAEKVWKEVCQKFTTYGGTSIPPKGRTIDCSAYVSWVIYEYGYTEFKGWQHTSCSFKTTNWNKKYGWEEIDVGSGENPYKILQPGDVFVRYGNGTHHVTLVVEKKKGDIYCYDCGSSKNWLERSKKNGVSGYPIKRTYFLTKTGDGKIIRVTSPK